MARPLAALRAAALLSLLLPHAGRTSKLDEEPELAVEQVRQEAVLEVKFARMKQQYGLADRRTLQVFFELFDLWIMLYRLNKADAALSEVLPACEWRRDDFAVKAVQALAFTRWKQARYREALARFHEMEGWMGKNPALCENIGHTYNTIGAYDKAEQYFKAALELIRFSPKNSEHNEGGVLLGLAGVQDRRGNHQEALPTAKRAYQVFKAQDRKRGWDTSLTAKAVMQVSKLHLRLGRLEEAEQGAREAVRIFEATAGEDSPLLVGALERLGAVLVRQGRRAEAREALHGAYKVAAIKDALDLVEILELHNTLLDTHLTDSSLDRLAFTQYFQVAQQVVDRVRREQKQDGNAGAFYKAAGELYVIGANCAKGKPLLEEAVVLFAGETSIDTTGLIRQCTDLVAFCDGAFDAATGAAAGGGGAAERGAEL